MNERTLGPIGTKVVYENDRVRIWQLRLAPGEESAVHRHELDHILIQVAGDRIAVDPEPSQWPVLVTGAGTAGGLHLADDLSHHTSGRDRPPAPGCGARADESAAPRADEA